MRTSALLLLSILFFTLSSYGQIVKESGNFRVKNYSSEEYDAHFQNWNVVQDPRGVMYFANNSTVLEFDGKNWASFKLGQKSLSVAIDDEGTIYAGGIGDIGYLKTNDLGQKEMVSLVDKIPEEHRNFQNIWRIATTDHGVYFKEKGSLFRYHNDSIEVIPAPAHPFFYSIGNDIFVTDTLGVNIMVDKHFEVLPHTETLNSTDQSLVHVLPAKNDKLLLVSRYNGIYLYDYKKAKATQTPEGSFDKELVSSDILQKLPTVFDDYLKKYQAYCVYRIQENQYAIGTLGGGVIIMDGEGQLIGIVNKSRGLVDNRIYYVYADQQNNLWAATNNGISCVYTSSPFRYFGSENGLNTGVLNTIRHKGTLYTSTYNSVYYLPEYTLQLENDIHQFKSIIDEPAWEFSIQKDKLFAGAYTNLYQIRGAESKKLYTASDVVSSIGYSKNMPDYLFVGISTGMSAVKLSNFSDENSDNWANTVETHEGLFNDYKYNTKQITSDKDGNLWVSTENNGLIYVNTSAANIEGIKISKIDTLNGLPYNQGNFAFIHKGEILITTNKGIYEVEKQNGLSKIRVIPSSKIPQIPEGYQSIKHLAFNGDIIYLSSNNGMLSIDNSNANSQWNETPFKEVQSIIWKQYIDADGSVWYNGNNGLVHYDTQNSKDYQKPYQALIRRVFINSDSVVSYGSEANSNKTKEEPNISLAYEDNSIKFEYNAVFYNYGEQLVYQYFLDGFDNQPSSWTSETKKEYTNLPEGDYCFNIKAKNVFSNESTTAKYYFNIRTPWYRAWYAYFAYIAALALIIYLAVKLNSKRLEKEKRQLEQIVSERTSEVVSQNEELHQQAEEILAQRDHIEGQNHNLIEANKAISLQKDQIEKSYNNISVLSNIGREVTSTLNTKEIIKMVYSHINELIKAEAFGIGVYNESRQTIDFDGFIEKQQEIPFNFDRISDKNSLSVHCFLNKKDILINDFKQEHTAYIEPVENAVEGGMPESIMYMPLLIEKQAVGVITVQSFTKNAYTENDKTVLSTLASYVAIAISNANSYEVIEEKNENITASIRYARTIQRAVLPKLEDLKKSFTDFFIIYRPKDIVSGDFYWHSQTSDAKGAKKQFIAVADCTGHGVPGAFMSMIGNTLLNEIINIKDIHDPARVLEELDASIKIALRQKESDNTDGMDIALCCLEYNNDNTITLEYAGAKRPLYWYHTENKHLEKVNATRRGIGGFDTKNKVFNKETLKINSGDIIYLQTDGMADQAKANGKKIGSTTIFQLISDNAKLPLSAQKERLLELLDKSQNTIPQRDDITLLGFKV